ncbi:hypothetical protein BDA99DRAFT_558962 [Phascolomyces articulosus]|uniref:Uncharacterized protein n=1 Tax=Phascolomyces articulosus TaxID=60185 RepID=A0AAD5PEF0_9FUNG|nr:hypothetical protein BDA99DRAFT_558962 [Phascolomyces articulosus]
MSAEENGQQQPRAIPIINNNNLIYLCMDNIDFKDIRQEHSSDIIPFNDNNQSPTATRMHMREITFCGGRPEISESRNTKSSCTYPSRDVWGTFIMSCSHVEHLDLGMTTDEVSLVSFVEAITSSMKQLHTLQLKDYGFITHLPHPGVCTNLHLLSHLSHQLESLGSHRCCIHVNELEALVNKLILM